MVEHCFVWPESPVKFRINNLRNMHYAVFGKKNAYWRDDTFAKLAEGCVPMKWCHVEVDEVVPTRRIVDVGSCVPAIKAAIDGLVEHCHLLPADSPEFVRSLKFNAPVYEKGEERLIITLKGPLA